MNVLEKEPNAFGQRQQQAADSRFFYTPEKDAESIIGESIINRISGLTTAFLDYYKLVLPVAPAVAAQLYFTPEGTLEDPDTMSKDRPVVTTWFSGQDIRSNNDVWNLTICYERYREEYSLQTVGRLWFKKSTYDAQGRLRSVDAEFEVEPIWNIIEASLSTKDSIEKMTAYRAKQEKYLEVKYAEIIPATAEVSPANAAKEKQNPEPAPVFTPESEEDVRIRVKQLLEVFDEEIKKSKTAKKKLNDIFPTDAEYFKHRRLFKSEYVYAGPGAKHKEFDHNDVSFIEVDRLMYQAGAETDMTSLVSKYVQIYAVPALLKMIVNRNEGAAISVGGRQYELYYVEDLNLETLSLKVGDQKVIFCDYLPDAPNVRLDDIQERLFILSDWLSAAK